ncbi:MAG: hypothetical protein JJU21_17140 [Salinarimonas sp.]|nr:hypothetical protein [Salinarimonas sp.]
MTFPASFFPPAGGKASGFSDTFGGSEPFALPGSKAADPGSPAMATAASPLVAQAAAPAGQLLGPAAIEALGRLGLGDLVRMVGPGSGYIAGGLTALLSELAFPQRTANADDMATLMRALAAEGATFDGHVAWETLPDGRPMMVLADDPDTIIAILQRDGTLFINPAFLPNGGSATSATASPMPEWPDQRTEHPRFGLGLGSEGRFGDRMPGFDMDWPEANLPEWSPTINIPDVSLDLEDISRRIDQERKRRSSTERDSGGGSRPDDWANGTGAPPLPDAVPVVVSAGGGVIRGPQEETREGLLGPDTPIRPDWRRTAGQEGFPTRVPGSLEYPDTGNADPSVPTTEAGPQIPPDPREFNPNTTFPPLETQAAAPAGQVSEVDEVEGARTVESIAELQNALGEYGIKLSDVLSSPDLPDAWRQSAFPRPEAQVLEMGTALLALAAQVNERFPGALEGLTVDISGPNPQDLTIDGHDYLLGLTHSETGFMLLESPDRIREILSPFPDLMHPDMVALTYAHEMGHALMSVASKAMHYLMGGYEPVTEFVSGDRASEEEALRILYPGLSFDEAFQQLSFDYTMRIDPASNPTDDRWFMHNGPVQVLLRPDSPPHVRTDMSLNSRANEREYAADVLMHVLTGGGPVVAREENALLPHLAFTLAKPLPPNARFWGDQVMMEAMRNQPRPSWAPEWREPEARQ